MVAAPRSRLLACALVASTALAGAAAARADDGGRSETRIEGRCAVSSDFSLRVRGEGGRLRIELRLDSERPYRTWTVVIVRERRLVFRGTVRPVHGGREVDLRRTVSDWPGTDTIVVRASTPSGESCRATVTV